MRFALLALGLTVVLAMSGCAVVYGIGVGLFYDEVELPDAQVVHDIRYVEGSDDAKHRLNLYLPTPDSVRTEGWPTVIFVHGGGWTEGDKDLTFGGADIYGNIGRYFASRGIGAVTANYRLLHGVTWPEQIDDVAHAVTWVGEHIDLYGGDPDALFLMGHSAGAQLATRVALDAGALPGTDSFDVCGVIAVSGAAYDLTDEETYALSNDPAYYARRFNPTGTDDDWRTDASPIRFASADALPFLILYAGGEGKALQRQSRLLDVALTEAGAESEVVIVPGQSHERILLTLSRDDRTAGPAMLDFARETECKRVPGDILGRWVVTKVLDRQGQPDFDSNEAGALTFSRNGIVQVERSQVFADQEPEWVRFRVQENRIVFISPDGEEEYGEYRFEGDTLIIVDHERGLTAYLQR